MSLTWVIPTSLLHLGGILLFMAVIMVFVDVKGKGVPWDRVAAGFAVVGGFGVGGAAGGWLGRSFAAISDTVLTNTQKFTAEAVGVSVVGAIVAGLLLWAFSRIQNKGKGIDAKTKLKSLVVVGLLAVAGTIFAAIPEIYGWVDSGVNWVGTTALTAMK